MILSWFFLPLAASFYERMPGYILLSLEAGSQMKHDRLKKMSHFEPVIISLKNTIISVTYDYFYQNQGSIFRREHQIKRK